MKKLDRLYKELPLIILCVSALLYYTVLLLCSQDNDMFFEITSGNDILNGNFYTASHLNNFPVIIQQWLYAVFMAIFDKMGYFGDILFVFIQNIILWLLASYFIYRKTKRAKLALIGSFITIIFSEYMINIRPQIITVILILVELLILDIYKERNRNIKYLFLLTPVLLLSANFHQAVYLYHLLFMLPYFIIKQDNKYRIDWKMICICLPLGLLCSLCTPYGIDGTLYIVNTFLSGAYNTLPINELQAISILSYNGVIFIILLAIVIWNIYKGKSDKTTDFYMFVSFLLALVNLRHSSIMFIGIIYMIRNSYFEKLLNKYLYYVLSACLLLFAIVTVPFIYDRREENLDIVNVIPYKDAKIYTVDIDIGGYFEYYGYTNINIDMRSELFSERFCGQKNILENLIALEKGKDNKGWYDDDELRKIVNGYSYVITNNTSYANKILTKGWHIIWEDDEHKIWENNKLTPKEVLHGEI